MVWTTTTPSARNCYKFYVTWPFLPKTKSSCFCSIRQSSLLATWSRSCHFCAIQHSQTRLLQRGISLLWPTSTAYSVLEQRISATNTPTRTPQTTITTTLPSFSRRTKSRSSCFSTPQIDRVRPQCPKPTTSLCNTSHRYTKRWAMSRAT